MASGITGPAGPQLQALFDAGTASGLSDGQLLERYLRRGEPGGRTAAEAAFACLIGRHGPMVGRVCRDILRDPFDADDAFQAVFLVLARRAGAIRRRESVGPWLYGVALRVARSARKASARRRERERRGAVMVDAVSFEGDRLAAAPALHEEVGRLPEKYRAAVVLCYFEGLTHEQAAGQLGWPIGTVRSRLAGARDRLRPRLTRRGLAPSAGFLAASAAAEGTSAIVPPALAAATVGIAMGAGEAGAVPASVAALAGRFLRITAMRKLSMIATGLVASGLVASAGAGLVAGQQAGDRSDATKQDDPKVDRAPAAAPPQALPGPGDRPVPDAGRGFSVPSGGSAVEPPGVLWVRLKNAIDVAQMKQQLFMKGELPGSESLAARNEVDVIRAQLEARRDELKDLLELLKAMLDIREADVATADAQLEQAAEKQGRIDALAKRNVVSNTEVQEARLNTAIRSAERAKKRAESAEVRVRIVQATRQLKRAEGLIAEANTLITKAAPTPGGSALPAPSPR